MLPTGSFTTELFKKAGSTGAANFTLFTLFAATGFLLVVVFALFSGDTVAGAASEILSFFFADYTAEFDMLADNCGMARLWAGIHWRSDHAQGVKLGRCVAQQVIKQLQAFEWGVYT